MASRRTDRIAPQIAPQELQERSFVANHPLLPDAALTPFRGVSAASPPPRCTGAHPNVFALAMASLARDFAASEPAMVEGAWPHCRGASHPQTKWRRLASRGSAAHHGAHLSAGLDESDWPIHWRASETCLAGPLRAVLDLLAEAFGPLTVNSTCRSPSHNRRVGGAPRSYHLSGNAVDFRVRSNYDEVLTFLKKMRTVGGLSHYGSGVFHIDTGPRRTWAPGSWRGARVRVARRT